MLKIADTIPVRTRLPAAAWVIAGVVTLASMFMTEAHAVQDAVPPCQVWASLW